MIKTPNGRIEAEALAHMNVEERVAEIMRRGGFEIDIRRALTNKFSMGSQN